MVAAAGCVVVYLLNLFMAEVHPGNLWGLSYGIAAGVLMVFVMLLGLRKRTKKIATRLGLGKSQAWVQLHVYGGALFLLLVFMHSGFRLPSGALAWWMFILSVWVTLSGIVGVALQKWIPKMLTSGLTVEVIYERIPELIKEISSKAEELIASSAEPVKEFYENNLAATLAAPQPRLIYYLDITGGINSQMKQFEYVRQFLSAEEKEKLRRLEALYKTKLEIDAHLTLQKALRGWLYTHVPLSLVLLMLVGIHLYSVLYY